MSTSEAILIAAAMLSFAHCAATDVRGKADVRLACVYKTGNPECKGRAE